MIKNETLLIVEQVQWNVWKMELTEIDQSQVSNLFQEMFHFQKCSHDYFFTIFFMLSLQ